MEGYTGHLRRPHLEEDRLRDRKPRPIPTSCEQCGKEDVPLKKYRLNTTDRGEGTASFHIVYKWLCEGCEPKRRQRKDPVKSDAELKALLKKARRSLR